MFISLTGTLYVIVNPQKGKDSTLKEHVLKDIVLRGFYARIVEIQEEYRQLTTQLQFVITDCDKKKKVLSGKRT